MLQIKEVVKTYATEEMHQDALKGVSVSFRDNEFVSILGHSGSGKTTLLNIIGGLDRYTSGDLIINGVSTKKYTDADWDLYRNTRIGFVFQSYNLIPHQSVLANVEMALTLSGVSRRERRERAVQVLNKVGLGAHIRKKPNQLSGGQMQRVAIARALVNNPDILLADEPTGALDSETSLPIMELLKEIAKDKLVIMVTHNPELAERYSTRILNLVDGKIVKDSAPCWDCDSPAKPKKQTRVSMSFLTALSLSFNNLRTKKARTLLTSIAGSIGIIGIALILALSTGMKAYISDVQKETMTAYPITIQSQTFDASLLAGIRNSQRSKSQNDASAVPGVHADYRAVTALDAVSSTAIQNNLTDFKRYLDDPNSEIRQYLGENGVVYSYDVDFNVYSFDADGKLVDAGSTPENSASTPFPAALASRSPNPFRAMSASSGENFSPLMAGANGDVVSQVVTDSYELLYGFWPREFHEVILVLDSNNSLSAQKLYQLGLLTGTQYQQITDAIQTGADIGDIVLDYADVSNHPLYLVAACDYYRQNENGTFRLLEDTVLNQNVLLENAVELRITGIVRPVPGANNANISTPVAYTSLLTDYLISHTAESAVVTAQLQSPAYNVLTGLRFEAATEEEKVTAAAQYVLSLGISEKASLYRILMYNAASSSQAANAAYRSMADAPMAQAAQAGTAPEPMTQSGISPANHAAAGETAMAAMLDQWLMNDPDPQILCNLYQQYIGESSLADNLLAFGSVHYDTPSAISIYADNFEDKEALAACIEKYNDGAAEASRISYTDFVALMTSSLTTIINGISYVLIAFVSISLVVSCFMIGIITHISVMERTKEIGILRALGASKGNISQVFNAETFIIGCCSGLVGIGISLFLLIPINSILSKLSGIESLSARLPVQSAAVLIVVSVIITVIGGLLPARSAARKDPVVALRAE